MIMKERYNVVENRVEQFTQYANETMELCREYLAAPKSSLARRLIKQTKRMQHEEYELFNEVIGIITTGGYTNDSNI